MSFSSRRRNYLLTPHRRDGLIEWMKSMLQHSFVLDALDTTGADTFSHFEMLIDEHRSLANSSAPNSKSKVGNDSENNNKNAPTEMAMNLPTNTSEQQSRLKQLVPTIGTFHTHLPLREAFEKYNQKHRLTKRKHIQISFNEIRHILNLAQIMAMANHTKEVAEENHQQQQEQLSNQNHHHHHHPKLNCPSMITFDGDQTLYSDGANFESNPRLATYLYQLLKHGVIIAVVTAAGYEYNVEKYEYRLSGLLSFFKDKGLTEEECERFYLFGGECNYLCRLGSDYRLHAVKEIGAGGWLTSTKYLQESPANWDPTTVTNLLNVAEQSMTETLYQLNLRGRIIRKKRAIGLIPQPNESIPREVLDEAVLRAQEKIDTFLWTGKMTVTTSTTSTPTTTPEPNNGNRKRDSSGTPVTKTVTTTTTKTSKPLPYCAFNGGKDAWVDVGNKRVGVQILQSYIGIPQLQTLHIGDQFLNTGNDYAARDVCPCIWICSPEETTYILKSILRLAGLPIMELSSPPVAAGQEEEGTTAENSNSATNSPHLGPTTVEEDTDENLSKDRLSLDFSEVQRRSKSAKMMDVYTGEIINKKDGS